MQHNHPSADTNGRFNTISRFVFLGFVAIALYFLITEHRAHVVPFLPFLLLAACPLMHLFHHHGGHSGHGGGADDTQDRQDKRPIDPPHQH